MCIAKFYANGTEFHVEIPKYSQGFVKKFSEEEVQDSLTVTHTRLTLE